MRTLVLIPLAYLAGVHGFVFLAPYLIIVFGAVQVTRMARLRRATAIAVSKRSLSPIKHPA